MQDRDGQTMMTMPFSDGAPGPAVRVNPRDMRRIILAQSKRANVGHIGSCLCVVEILSALYGGVIRMAAPDDRDRDRFVLAKGHAGLALYAALALRGLLSDADLDTFCGDSSALGVHPEIGVPGIDFATGSLGHGLSLALGAGLAARLQGSSRRVYCLMSDAECNEGSVWEAAMFAAHHRLDNVTAVIDVNGQQALGLTRDVMDLSNLAQRWEAFGWQSTSVDGHSVPDLARALAAPGPRTMPRVILARTTFGKGVSFMERGRSPARPQIAVQPVNWHYLPMSDDEFRLAIAEIEAGA